MTQPDIGMDPRRVRAHATQVTGQGQHLSTTTHRALQTIGIRDNRRGEIDELVHTFLQVYEPRAQQAEARAHATAEEFTRLGESATRIVDVYERVDADAATDLAREQGLLPPR